MTLTQNQRLILNAFISILLSALGAAVTAMMQKSSAGGHVDPAAVLSIGLFVFGGSFWPALVNFVPSHALAEIAALRDTATQAQQSHNALLEEIGNAFEMYNSVIGEMRQTTLPQAAITPRAATPAPTHATGAAIPPAAG